LMALIVLAYVLCVCQGIREFKKIRRQSKKNGGYLKKHLRDKTREYFFICKQNMGFFNLKSTK
ncbi:MAG: hypothetical protein ACI85I_002523, partial [Arenicella sp.]